MEPTKDVQSITPHGEKLVEYIDGVVVRTAKTVQDVLVIPRGVYHAVQNVGSGDAYFVNMPSRSYDHENPDKYRLSVASGLIPYSFEDRLGW